MASDWAILPMTPSSSLSHGSWHQKRNNNASSQTANCPMDHVGTENGTGHRTWLPLVDTAAPNFSPRPRIWICSRRCVAFSASAWPLWWSPRYEAPWELCCSPYVGWEILIGHGCANHLTTDIRCGRADKAMCLPLLWSSGNFLMLLHLPELQPAAHATWPLSPQVAASLHSAWNMGRRRIFPPQVWTTEQFQTSFFWPLMI